MNDQELTKWLEQYCLNGGSDKSLIVLLKDFQQDLLRVLLNKMGDES